jgi:hypothetical protein
VKIIHKKEYLLIDLVDKRFAIKFGRLYDYKFISSVYFCDYLFLLSSSFVNSVPFSLNFFFFLLTLILFVEGSIAQSV